MEVMWLEKVWLWCYISPVIRESIIMVLYKSCDWRAWLWCFGSHVVRESMIRVKAFCLTTDHTVIDVTLVLSKYHINPSVVQLPLFSANVPAKLCMCACAHRSWDERTLGVCINNILPSKNVYALISYTSLQMQTSSGKMLHKRNFRRRLKKLEGTLLAA